MNENRTCVVGQAKNAPFGLSPKPSKNHGFCVFCFASVCTSRELRFDLRITFLLKVSKIRALQKCGQNIERVR